MKSDVTLLYAMLLTRARLSVLIGSLIPREVCFQDLNFLGIEHVKEILLCNTAYNNKSVQLDGSKFKFPWNLSNIIKMFSKF